MEQKPVSMDTHDGRCKIEDERFARDKERLDAIEYNVDKVTTLSVQMGEIIKQNNETLKNHDQRLTAIENKPGKVADSVKIAIIVAICTSIAGAIMGLILKL